MFVQEGGLRGAVVDLANLVQVNCDFMYCNGCGGGCGSGGLSQSCIDILYPHVL